MDRDRRPVAYATFAWLVAVGLLVAIVAVNTSPPPDILGEPAGQPHNTADEREPEPAPPAPIPTRGPAASPAPGNVTVPQDTNYTFNGSVRSDRAGPGAHSYRITTNASNGLVGVTVAYHDRQPTNTTTFPGQKTNVRYELFRNGTRLASGFVSPTGWGDGGRIAGFVDKDAMGWEIRLSYDWPSDFDYTFHVKVDYPD